MAEYIFVLSDDSQVPVVINSRRGLRNITIRPKFAPVREIHISKPWLVSDRAAIKFLESKQRWVESVFAKCPEKQAIYPNMELEFLGRRVLLVHDSTRHSNKFQILDDGTAQLIIGGDISMFPRRVRDFIKAEFLRELKNMIHSAPREFWPARIAVRDTTSRWGSCSSTGTMSFSWRLAFAPTDVMRYVVMHELAHKKHMDHSPEFWAEVRGLYGFGVERAKRWLAQNGAGLHALF